MIIAGLAAWFAYKQYLQPPVQENDPSEAIDVAASPISSELLVFKTSKQKTFLKIGSNGLECRLEDTRPGKGGPQWSLNKQEVDRILEFKDFSVVPGYKARTGLFTLGARKNWLYSKKLFPEPEFLRGALKDLMEQVVL